MVSNGNSNPVQSTPRTFGFCSRVTRKKAMPTRSVRRSGNVIGPVVGDLSTSMLRMNELHLYPQATLARLSQLSLSAGMWMLGSVSPFRATVFTPWQI